MDRRRAGFQLDAVASSLPDNFRNLHVHILRAGHDNAVACRPHLVQRVGNLVVFLLGLRQLLQQRQQVAVVPNGKSALFAEDLVKQALREVQDAGNHSCPQVDGADPVVLYGFQFADAADRRFRLADLGNPPRAAAHGVVQRLLQGVLRFQRLHPAGQEEMELGHGEFIQQLFQDFRNLRFLQRQAVNGHTADAVRPADVFTELARRLPLRFLGVDQHQKRLPGRLHIPDRPILRLFIVRPGDIGDGAVRRHNNADGPMILHHLPGSQLRGLRHGNLMVVPRRGDHSRLPVLIRPNGAHHHIAHRIDQPDRQLRRTVRADFHSLLRHKFRLRRHDGFPGAALGQLIPGPLTSVYIIDIGNDQFFHDPLDKR